MHMMRHSSPAMTPVYGRVVIERMKDAVKDHGKSAQSMVYDFERTAAKIGQMMPGMITTPMEYFRIHAKR